MPAPCKPPRRGVELVYTPRLHDLFIELADRIDVAEIEPQTAWTTVDPISGPFGEIDGLARLWSELPQQINLHSVAMPLAGRRAPNASQMSLLKDLVGRFEVPYVSEHLSVGGTPHQHAGFLLPPRQTRIGVDTAARNIRTLQVGVGAPIAVETGVSYLPPYPGEIRDGDYVRAVAEAADCGILFDVHNIYCNQLNGRQSLLDFAAALPAERVWELHIAGGMEREGFWLDAHSGEPPPALVELTRRIVRGLPALSTIVFEIYPAYLRDGSRDILLRSLDVTRELWEQVGGAQGDGLLTLMPLTGADDSFDAADLKRWEEQLTQGVRFALPVELGAELSATPAMGLYHMLAHSFRSSSIARLMPRTLRLIAMCGRDFEALLWDYEREVPPPLFSLNEANAFVEWMNARPSLHPAIGSLMAFELAMVSVPVTGKAASARFSGDPQPLFQALSEGTPLPTELSGPPWYIEITPDEIVGPAPPAAMSS